MFTGDLTLSFRGSKSTGYEVIADGRRVGRVWQAHNALLGRHWKNSRLHLLADPGDAYAAFRTRRDAALDLCGLAVEFIEPS